MIHYYPPEPLFGWNNEPSLMRTQSASYRDYPQSSNFHLRTEKKKSFCPSLHDIVMNE
jgi:hypothetical protein